MIPAKCPADFGGGAAPSRLWVRRNSFMLFAVSACTSVSAGSSPRR